MAITILESTEEIISLSEFINYCDEHIHNGNADSLMACSKQLKMLSNNKIFLRSFIYDELFYHSDNLQKENTYLDSQALIVYVGKSYQIRITTWPNFKNENELKPNEKPLYKNAIGHDHNFWFMTVGYIGSGYQTEIWEYDCNTVKGYLGEKVNMHFLEKTKLTRGKIMVYRPSCDLHEQGKADHYSIAINVILKSNERYTNPVYGFDLHKKEIAFKVDMNKNAPIYSIVNMLTHVDIGKNYDLLNQLSSKHPMASVRDYCTTALKSFSQNLEATSFLKK